MVNEMKIIVAVDDNFGMMFNHRRQSQDKILREKIIEISKNSVLWMNEYSFKQFAENTGNIKVSESFLDEAGEDDYCFVEDKDVSNCSLQIKEMIIFKWNRKYPGDLFLEYLPEKQGMKCNRTEELQGNSHDKITMELWGNDF